MIQGIHPTTAILTTLLGLTLGGASPMAQKPHLGQVLSEDRLVDKDFCFSLERPDRSWRLLGEKEIQRLVPDAVAGLTLVSGKGQGMLMRVKIHALHGASLEDMADVFVDIFDDEDAAILSRKACKLSGREGVHLVARRRRDGHWSRFSIWILTRNGYAFIFVAHGDERWHSDGKLFAKIPAAIRFLDGKVRPRIGPDRIADTHGIGWRVRDHVYSSAATGLRLRPAPGWRLIVGQEVLERCPENDVGILLPGQDIRLTVRSELVPVGAEAAYLQSCSHLPPLDEPLPKGESMAQWRCLGKTRSFHVVDHQELLPHRSFHAVWISGGRAWHVSLRHNGLDRPHLHKQIEAALDGISRLDEVEVELLGRELKGLRDHENAVGLDYSLRGGVYRDFKYGFVWKKPQQGFWTARSETQVRELQPGCRLSAMEIASGVEFALFADTRESKDAAVHHRAKIQLSAADLVATKTGQTKTWQLNGRTARTTILDGTLAGEAYRYRVTTLPVGKNIVSMITSGLRGNLEAAEAMALSAESNLVNDEQFHRTQRTKKGYIDLHAGFGIQPLLKEALIEDITPEQLRPAASWVQIQDGKVNLVILATTCSMTNETLVSNLLGQARSNTFFSPISGDPTSKTTVQFLGLPATRLLWKNWLGDSEIIVLRRDNTTYTFTGRSKAEGWEKLISKIYWTD